MKKVLFVCIENSCRSQMAEAFAKYYGAGLVESYSAGSRPSHRVNVDAMQVMAEKGISLSSHYSKGLDELPEGEWDYVIGMGCGESCPTVKAKKRIEWAIDDPKGQSMAFFREVRDQIEKKVLGLLKSC